MNAITVAAVTHRTHQGPVAFLRAAGLLPAVTSQTSSTMVRGNHNETIGTHHPSHTHTVDRRRLRREISWALSKATPSQIEATIQVASVTGSVGIETMS